MAITQDFQWDLNGYTFGYRMPISADQSGFSIEPGAIQDQDQINPMTGARMMGRDVRSAGSWSWMMHMNTETDAEALAELARFGAIWTRNGQGWENTGEVAMLTYRLAGRDRVVFGRPREFDYELDNRILGGYIPPSAKFALSSPLHFSAAEQSVVMKLGADAPGGLSLPSAWPFSFETAPGFVPSWAMTVGGDSRTSPIVKFTGPCLNPSVTIGTFKLGFAGSLPEGASIEVDCRPWAQTFKRVGSTADLVATRDTRLNRAVFYPGTYAAQYRGLDLTGQSSCQVRWRDAWVTL